jgi:hypothetical protein
MAQRSSGLYPREGFNLDAQCEIPVTTPAAAAVTLTNAKTIRVIAVNLVGGDATVTLGGEAIVLAAADADQNGVVIGHVRGALCTADNNVVYTLSAGTVGGVFYELVDGPRR